MTRLTFPAFCCLAAIALVVPSVQASVVIVDDFDDGKVDLTANSGTTSASLIDQPTTSAVGGFRDTTVTWVSGALDVSAKRNPAPGEMAFSSERGVVGLFNLVYDGDGSGLSGLDITDGGSNVFLFLDIVFDDLGGEILVTLEDNSATSFSLSKSLTPGPELVAFKLSDFIGVDLAALESISVDVIGVEAGDYAIDSIYAGVPEPSTIAIWSLFGVGMAVYVRRQRKN